MFRRVPFLAGLVGLLIASSASAQVKLEYKFLEGSSTNNKATLRATENFTIGDANLEIASEVESTSTLTIGKRAADGTLPVKQKANSIKVHVSAGGQEFDIDSADPNAKFDNADLQSALTTINAVIGSEYSVLLTGQNEFKGVEGIDKILDKVKDDAKATADLKTRLSEAHIKREFESEYNNLPKVLATKGDTWEATEVDDVGTGQTLTFRRRYEYLGTKEKDGRTLDEFSVQALDAKFESDPDASPQFAVVKSDVKVESSKGTVLFDRQAGRVVERKTEDAVKGDATLKINGMEIPSKVELKLEQTQISEDAKK